MTLGSHQQSIGRSQNHITPRWIIDALGPFDLDPAAADPRPWPCAAISWTAHGLERDWAGFVYLNPPFDRYVVGDWIAKLARHGHGITLLHARTETAWFEPIWQHAAAILFLDRQKYGNEGERQSARAKLPAMSSDYIDAVCIEFARVVKPAGYLLRWIDKYCLCQGTISGFLPTFLKS